MLLSPDGTTIAVGGYFLRGAELLLVELATGDDSTYPVVGGHTVLPLAWSPDATLLATGEDTPGPSDLTTRQGWPDGPVGSAPRACHRPVRQQIYVRRRR